MAFSGETPVRKGHNLEIVYVLLVVEIKIKS